MEKKRTINLMISPEADTRLRALTAELKQPMGVIVAQAIMQYQATEADQPGDNEDRLLALETRLLALESHFEAIGAVGIVSDAPAAQTPVAADLVPCATVESAGAETPAVIKAMNLAKFKSAVVECWNAGMKGYAQIAKELEARKFCNSNGNPYSRNAVMNALREAKLVEVKDGTPEAN